METILKNKETFLCKIADIVTEVPNVSGLAKYCEEYIYDGCDQPEIFIDKNLFDYQRFVGLPEDMINYLEAGRLFHARLLLNEGIYMHGSAVEVDDKVYLFTGPSGRGKSTHTNNWQRFFGKKAHIINDDKPSLRMIDGKWYVYGTPWSGKNHININTKAPLVGICFLEQASCNRIRKLSPSEAVNRLIFQTIYKYRKAENLDIMIRYMEDIITTIPIFELENLPNEEAVQLSYTTMLNAAKEAGL